METIIVKDKTFVIKKFNHCDNEYNPCHKCLFYNNNHYPNSAYHCLMTRCYDFIVIREANVIDRIRMWFKKKINK